MTIQTHLPLLPLPLFCSLLHLHRTLCQLLPCVFLVAPIIPHVINILVCPLGLPNRPPRRPDLLPFLLVFQVVIILCFFLGPLSVAIQTKLCFLILQICCSHLIQILVQILVARSEFASEGTRTHDRQPLHYFKHFFNLYLLI